MYKDSQELLSLSAKTFSSVAGIQIILLTSSLKHSKLHRKSKPTVRYNNCHMKYKHMLTQKKRMLHKIGKWSLRFTIFLSFKKGPARTLGPTNKNCALEPPLFGVVVRVSPLGVQWMGLAVETHPSWSMWSPCQVSMLEPNAFLIMISSATICNTRRK